MPFVPFRAKNKPERFPVATLTLIVINIVVLFFTSQFGRVETPDPFGGKPDVNYFPINEDAVNRFALSWATWLSEPWRLVTHTFLHGDFFHVLGNMLAIWLFGPALEGRLGHIRFVGLYLLTGMFAGFFQSLVAGVLNPEQFVLGASGAAMGLAGAYLWVFPFATIVVAVILPYGFRIAIEGGNPLTWIRPLTFDVYARWVVLAYFVGDLWSAVWNNGYGGVANFAHVAGLIAGLGVVGLFRVQRDGRRASDARKMQAEGVNLNALSVAELSTLLAREPDNERMILAYADRITDRNVPGWENLLADALHRFGYILSEKMDAQTLAVIVASVSPDVARLPAPPVLRIGTRLERGGKPEDLRLAAQLYRTMFKQEKSGPDAEMALLKYAQVMEKLVAQKLSDNPNEPVLLYQTLLRRFPASPHIFPAQEGLKRLGAPLPDGF